MQVQMNEWDEKEKCFMVRGSRGKPIYQLNRIAFLRFIMK